MPCDSTPRSFAALMCELTRELRADARPARSSVRRAHSARRTRSAAAAPPPRQTRQTCSLSACGCGSALRISATTTPVNSGAALLERLELEAGHGEARAELAALATAGVTHSASQP